MDIKKELKLRQQIYQETIPPIFQKKLAGEELTPEEQEIYWRSRKGLPIVSGPTIVELRKGVPGELSYGGSKVAGEASLDLKSITVYRPRKAGYDPKDLAATFAHELGHLKVAGRVETGPVGELRELAASYWALSKNPGNKYLRDLIRKYKERLLRSGTPKDIVEELDKRSREVAEYEGLPVLTKKGV